MDDEPLAAGKDYLVKLGTKTIPGVVTKINYAVDVNTGDHKEVDSLNKNGIAVCEILLTEAIAADKFESHKTLGELILIDRVSNMTSACGVVEDVSEREGSEEKASFEYNGIKARGDIFEEFYYNLESLSVLKYRPAGNTYTVGDEIPVTGESYKYPDSFDIIVLRDSVAVKVRDKKITEIITSDEYTYSGAPLINGRGFEVKVFSQEDAEKFLQEYENADNGFFTKWMNFDTYRKVALHHQYPRR